MSTNQTFPKSPASHQKEQVSGQTLTGNKSLRMAAFSNPLDPNVRDQIFVKQYPQLRIIAKPLFKGALAIDGGAGTGKTEIGGIIASVLGVPFLDTGVVFRSVTLFAKLIGYDLSKQLAPKQIQNLVRFIESIEVPLPDPSWKTGKAHLNPAFLMFSATDKTAPEAFVSKFNILGDVVKLGVQRKTFSCEIVMKSEGERGSSKITNRVLFNGIDVSEVLNWRHSDLTMIFPNEKSAKPYAVEEDIKAISGIAAIRDAYLVKAQLIVQDALKAFLGAVVVGRDVQSKLLPKLRRTATFKFFLKSPPELAAQRRAKSMFGKFDGSTLKMPAAKFAAMSQQAIETRNAHDAQLKHGSFKAAVDSIVLTNQEGRTLEGLTAEILAHMIASKDANRLPSSLKRLMSTRLS